MFAEKSVVFLYQNFNVFTFILTLYRNWYLTWYSYRYSKYILSIYLRLRRWILILNISSGLGVCKRNQINICTYAVIERCLVRTATADIPVSALGIKVSEATGVSSWPFGNRLLETERALSVLLVRLALPLHQNARGTPCPLGEQIRLCRI